MHAWLAQAQLFFFVWPNDLQPSLISNGLSLKKIAHVLGWLDSLVSVTDHFLALIFQTNLMGEGR